MHVTNKQNQNSYDDNSRKKTATESNSSNSDRQTAATTTTVTGSILTKCTERQHQTGSMELLQQREQELIAGATTVTVEGVTDNPERTTKKKKKRVGVIKSTDKRTNRTAIQLKRHSKTTAVTKQNGGKLTLVE